MHEKYLFEYAVVRIVPRVEREEFLNVGVVLYCAKQHLLLSLFNIDHARLKAFCGELDLAAVGENCDAFQRICVGGEGAGPIGKLDAASRFRWLTATRSTVLQCSGVHPGFCVDARETLQKLYSQLVL